MILNAQMTAGNENKKGTLWSENRPMMVLVVGSLLFLAVCGVGLVADSAEIINERAWIKPLKFGLSSAIYGITLLWMMRFLDGKTRWARIASWVISVGLLIELAAIGLQAFRGVRSHFNVSTAFDGAIFSLMGATIMAVWLATIVIGVLLMRQNIQPVALGDGIRWGLLASIIGMALAFLMTSPTAQQMASWQAGAPVVEAGAHSVGVADGGAGLPFVGWSTEGGDLRIGHFIGIHGMQILPLLGLWLMNKPAVSDNKTKQRRLMALSGLGYIGVTLLVTWQALRGQSIIAPDALTLIAFAGLVAGVLIPSLWLYRNPS